MILNFFEQLIILNKVTDVKSKTLFNVIFGTNKDKSYEATIRKDLAEAKDNSSIVYLQICTGFEKEDCVKLLSSFANKELIHNYAKCFKNDGNTLFEQVYMDLKYPNHQCWDYCLPLKGGVEYKQEDGTIELRDLGLCCTGSGWSAAIVYGEEDQKYMSGGSEGSFWFSQKCYKDLLNFSIDLGIHPKDYIHTVADSYRILEMFMASDKDYWDLKVFFDSE